MIMLTSSMIALSNKGNTTKSTRKKELGKIDEFERKNVLSKFDSDFPVLCKQIFTNYAKKYKAQMIIEEWFVFYKAFCFYATEMFYNEAEARQIWDEIKSSNDKLSYSDFYDWYSVVSANQ